MSTQIVIDIETLGTEVNAVILSVALVLVDTTQAIGSALSIKDQMVFNPDITYQQGNGRSSERSTEIWWEKQNEEAKKEAFSSQNRTNFIECLLSIHDWIKKYDCPIWGNGSDFDNKILANAFKHAALEWPFWHNRCLRTLKNVTKDLYPEMELPDFRGVKHIALNDALHEARELVICLSYLNAKN